MTKAQQQVVISIWNEIENGEERVSTERLFAMTRERASQALGVSVDDGDISSAIKAEVVFDSIIDLRHQVTGEVGFAGLTVKFCPKHGNVISCSCPGGRV